MIDTKRAILICVLIFISFNLIDAINIKIHRSKIVGATCAATMNSLKGGNKKFTAAIQIAQNMFRDMSSSSSGEVRNKFRKDFSRVLSKISSFTNTDAKELAFYKLAEVTSTSVEDIEKAYSSSGANLATDLTLTGTQQAQNGICDAFSDVINELTTNMKKHQNNNDLAADAAGMALKVVGAGLTAGAAAATAGASVVATGIITAIQGVNSIPDSTFFNSKLNAVMRTIRIQIWEYLRTLISPGKITLATLSTSGDATVTGKDVCAAIKSCPSSPNAGLCAAGKIVDETKFTSPDVAQPIIQTKTIPPSMCNTPIVFSGNNLNWQIKCDPNVALKVINEIRGALLSVITKDDRDNFRKDCREGQEPTYRIASGQTIWTSAIKAYFKWTEEDNFNNNINKFPNIFPNTEKVIQYINSDQNN
jgi:hypothetical protein